MLLRLFIVRTFLCANITIFFNNVSSRSKKATRKLPKRDFFPTFGNKIFEQNYEKIHLSNLMRHTPLVLDTRKGRRHVPRMERG